jgi:hypothetical protein
MYYVRPVSFADTKSVAYKNYSFSIETKDGKLIRTSIQLNSSPRKILESMSTSINFPPPPEGELRYEDDIAQTTDFLRSNSTMQNHIRSSPLDDLIWNAGMFGGNRTTSRTIRDCNLLNFLKDMNTADIKKRKLDRINASAAALVARRAYQFSAIDGTGLGWSSASLAMLLSKLTELYDEHKSKLNTNSFYPFRLVLSGDEFNKKIDLYSGVILLNPAATPLQWLNTLQAVTDKSVSHLKRNRKELEKNLSIVESFLGVRVTKGYSCEAGDYHNFIESMAVLSVDYNPKQDDNTSVTPILNNACLVIESDQACRRCKLRKDGNIEAGVGMNAGQIRRALHNFAAQSNEYKQIQSQHKNEVEKVKERMVYEYGVQSIKKVGTLVTEEQVLDCLMKLLNKKEMLRNLLTGQTLGITGRDQPCHLGDDGSIVIPWNVS